MSRAHVFEQSSINILDILGYPTLSNLTENSSINYFKLFNVNEKL